MNRRTLVASVLAVGVAGCVGRSATAEDETDAPSVTANENDPQRYLLTRLQPQTFDEVTVGDAVELGVVLANVGGEPATGDPAVTVVSPDDERRSVSVPATDTLPSGASRSYETEPVTFETEGTWRVLPGAAIDGTHETYDGEIPVTA